MSRYIDADIAKEKLKEYCVDDDGTVQYWYDLMGIDDCIDKIIPTADVVEVVRCKDCKYRSKEWYRDKRYKDGGYWIVGCGNDEISERVYGLAQDNDFCSYGERRNEV